MPSRRGRSKPPHTSASGSERPTSTLRDSAPPQPTISFRWLATTAGIAILAAIACAWATLCILFWQGSWQLLYHPTSAIVRTPASVGLAFDSIGFASDAAGAAQLRGWWIPGTPQSRYTAIYLHGANGNLGDTIDDLLRLHGAGLNVFAFDYRGYGFSANLHPSQQRMTEDTEAAWRYLTTTRGVSPATIIPYGVGVGVSLAAHLAATHPEIPALILDSPHADLLDFARRESPSLLPVRLLFRETFPLAEPISGLRTPKLLLADAGTANPAAFATAADPKLTVFLPSRTGLLFDQAMERFLDAYLDHLPVPSLAPSATNPR